MGGVWGRCDPDEPKNRRRRPALLVQSADATLLVDAGPDLRQQLLDAGVSRIDAVLFTHAHADHCHGLDDLRPLVYRQDAPIPAFGDVATMAALRERFDYAFASSRTTGAFYSALMSDHTIEPRKPFQAAGFECLAIAQDHGTMPTVGYRIGPIGYSPDAVDIDQAGLNVLAGVDLWVVDCLRYEPHPTHAHFDRTLSWIEQVQPGRAVFTHMNHTLDYHDVRSRCPERVEPGYDGMVISLTRGTV